MPRVSMATSASRAALSSCRKAKTSCRASIWRELNHEMRWSSGSRRRRTASCTARCHHLASEMAMACGLSAGDQSGGVVSVRTNILVHWPSCTPAVDIGVSVIIARRSRWVASDAPSIRIQRPDERRDELIDPSPMPAIQPMQGRRQQHHLKPKPIAMLRTPRLFALSAPGEGRKFLW
jgi:hypothetical protein